MTAISPSSRLTSYSPTTDTTNFPVNFPLFDNDDLFVTLDGEPRTDFTVSATYVNGISTDASVVMNVGVSGQVWIAGLRPPSRTDQFQTGRPLPIEAFNYALNRLEIEAQEARRDIDRAVLSEFGSSQLLIDPTLEDGDTLMLQGNKLTKGPQAADIANAEGFAVAAAISAEAALASEIAAENAVARNNISSDPFAADGVTTDFALSHDPGSAANVFILVEGPTQLLTSYTLIYAGAVAKIRFSVAPPKGTVGEFRYGNAVAVNVPADGSVTAAKLSGVTTDSITEGAAKYFTAARVLSTVLAGLDLTVNAAISAADTVLGALGKLQKQVTDLTANKQAVVQLSTLGVTQADALTQYFGCCLSATETAAIIRCPVAGTITRMDAQCSGVSAGTRVYTLRKNLVDTTMICQSTVAGTQASDTTHPITVAAGDILSIKLVTSGSGTAASHAVSLAIRP